MLMIRSVTQPCRCCHGIQCGIARMSIVASTGSPSDAADRAATLQRADRLVVAHVLVDGERDAGVFAEPHDLLRLRRSSRRAASGQDAADLPCACTTSLRITSICTSGGTAMSTTSTFGSSSISCVRVVRRRDAGDVPRRPCALRGIARRNRDRVEPRLPIRHQVAIGHDEARPDAADANLFTGSSEAAVGSRGRWRTWIDQAQQKGRRGFNRGDAEIAEDKSTASRSYSTLSLPILCVLCASAVPCVTYCSLLLLRQLRCARVASGFQPRHVAGVSRTASPRPP